MDLISMVCMFCSAMELNNFLKYWEREAKKYGHTCILMLMPRPSNLMISVRFMVASSSLLDVTEKSSNFSCRTKPEEESSSFSSGLGSSVVFLFLLVGAGVTLFLFLVRLFIFSFRKDKKRKKEICIRYEKKF